MNKVSGIILTVAGLVLLVWGINASHSVASDISRLFTGQPTDRAVWMVIGGAVLTALGLGSAAFR